MSEVTLSKAEAAFTHWRTHRSKPKEPIPQYLWDIVAQLRQYHNQTDICRRLKINSAQFRNKMTGYGTQTTNKNDAFVTRPPAKRFIKHDGLSDSCGILKSCL